MAGLGARLFPAFSKLTSAQVNGYLMDQTIMRFASSAARDAAFGGVGEPTLAEGMTCYLDDTNVLQSYNGTTWVSVAASSTVSDVSSGLVFVKQVAISTTPAATIVVTDAFSATYDNYRVQISNFNHSASGGNMLITLSGAGSGWYSNVTYTQAGSNTFGVDNLTNNARAFIGITDSSCMNMTLDFYSPFLVKQKSINSNYISSGANLYAGFANSHTANTTSSTGFTLSASSGTLVNGIVTIHGYRKS